jgi:hypothetical protein
MITGIMYFATTQNVGTNPLGDWSQDFWKALANWIDALSTGKIPSATKFRLYVTPPHQGELVQAMSDAWTPPGGCVRRAGEVEVREAEKAEGMRAVPADFPGGNG